MSDPAAPAPLHLELAGGDPLGRGDQPTLSWQLPIGARLQLAYRVVSDDGYDTGRVDAPEQLHVRVPVFDRPRRDCALRVRVWTDLGESPWSDPVEVRSGLLTERDWSAPWVFLPDAPSPGERGAAWVRRVVDVGPGALGSARLYVSALGLYEVLVNGVRVGTQELAPGYTQYRERVCYAEHEVGPALRPRANVVAVLVADGWYRGQVGLMRSTDEFGTRRALRVQLEVRRPGETTWSLLVGTDDRWRAGASHVLAADLIGGQREDHRRLDPAVHDASFDDTGWAGVEPAELDVALTRSPAPPVRRIEELPAVSVCPLPGRDAQIVDLGQNINGWVRLSDLGPAGTRLTLRHGEHLDADGDLTTTHLEPDLPFLPHPLPLGQIDEVVSAGAPGEVFEPRLTTHGFRYVRVEGHPGALAPADVTGVVVHSDLRRTGWFSCSDDRVTRLHEAAVWSFRGNMCGVPTDCPQRERAGWTGDWQVFAPTAAYLFDVLGFTRSWLRDVALDQAADGRVANMSPCPPGEGFEGPIGGLHASAGWGDVVVSAPWALYEAYDDPALLTEVWPTLTAWLCYAAAQAASHRHPDRAASCPEPAAHEEFLWDSGFHWGEWLEPGESIDDFAAFAVADKSEVATAYLARSARIAARIGEIIGADDAVLARYRRLAAGAVGAWRAEFVAPDGSLRVDTQASHVRALAFDLAPAGSRSRVARRLATLVAAADDHLGTGFLSTGLLLPTLAENGQLEAAYTLLMQDTEPSWLTMIDRGATTIWERWNGVDADGRAHESLNHYSLGAVVSFLHRHVAGLRPAAPGYRRFRVEPRPGGGLTWARTAHESPYGRIDVAWERTFGERLHLEVQVPAGTTAEVVLPGSAPELLGPGRHVRAT